MNSRFALPTIIAWALVGACWFLLFRASRRRASMMKKLAAEHAGFLRKQFFFPTLSLEPVDLAWTKIFAGEPVAMSIRYELPLTGLSVYPQTIFEIEVRESLFGGEGGTYSRADLAAGRGLFLAGTNQTGDFREFCAITPHSSRFRMGWKGPRAWLSVPGLLDTGEEYWVRHCTKYMEETAGRIMGGSSGPKAHAFGGGTGSAG